MSMLAALMMLATAPASAAEAPPRPQATSVGVVRARILSPVRLQQQLSDGATTARDRLVTHQRPRRDGAEVIDAY
jgi:hypothetical protein